MNEIAQIINDWAPIIDPTLGAVVGTVLGMLFARKNARINAIETVKAEKFNLVLSEMLDTGKMTYMELYKCKNFLQVAKYADEMIKEQGTTRVNDTNYDIDWFVRFFDAVGNVSNQDMQVLWAKILKGEIENPNLFSLRTIETVHNLSSKEAKIFEEITAFILKEQNGMYFLLNTTDDYSKDINVNYGINNEKILLMQDCGLLGPMKTNVRIDTEMYPSEIWNDSKMLEIHFKQEDLFKKIFKFDCFPLTTTAKQIFPLVKKESNQNYLEEISKQIDDIYYFYDKEEGEL